MNTKLPKSVPFIFVVLTQLIAACSAIAPEPTPTATQTTAPTFTPTMTHTPTKTPTPTATPNLVATQQYEDFFPVVQKYYDADVIPSLNGSYQLMGDYSDQTTDAGTYRWDLYDNEIGSFIVRADIKLETAPAPASQSGCGFVFGLVDSDSHEFVFLQRNGSAVYGIGGHIFTTNYYDQLQNPAEFAMVIIALDNEVRVAINDKEVIKIPLDHDRSNKFAWGPALLAGSTQEFGTRCTFTNVELWEISP